jgi:hypothetical protein
MTLHIHIPASWTCRRIARCPHCKSRTRHLQTIFAWYDPYWECGKCGTHTHFGRGKKATAERLATFQDRWKKAMTLKEVMAGMMNEVQGPE